MALALALCMGSALAAPELSGKLMKAAKSAAGYLAAGEYERLVTLLPFSASSLNLQGFAHFLHRIFLGACQVRFLGEYLVAPF